MRGLRLRRSLPRYMTACLLERAAIRISTLAMSTRLRKRPYDSCCEGTISKCPVLRHRPYANQSTRCARVFHIEPRDRALRARDHESAPASIPDTAIMTSRLVTALECTLAMFTTTTAESKMERARKTNDGRASCKLSASNVWTSDWQR